MSIEDNLKGLICHIYNKTIFKHNADETILVVKIIIDKLLENMISFILYNKPTVTQHLQSLSISHQSVIDNCCLYQICHYYRDELNHAMIEMHFNNMTYEECVILLNFKNIYYDYNDSYLDFYSLIQLIFSKFIELDGGLLVRIIQFDPELFYTQQITLK